MNFKELMTVLSISTILYFVLTLLTIVLGLQKYPYIYIYCGIISGIASPFIYHNIIKK